MVVVVFQAFINYHLKFDIEHAIACGCVNKYLMCFQCVTKHDCLLRQVNRRAPLIVTH